MGGFPLWQWYHICSHIRWNLEDWRKFNCGPWDQEGCQYFGSLQTDLVVSLSSPLWSLFLCLWTRYLTSTCLVDLSALESCCLWYITMLTDKWILVRYLSKWNEVRVTISWWQQWQQLLMAATNKIQELSDLDEMTNIKARVLYVHSKTVLKAILPAYVYQKVLDAYLDPNLLEINIYCSLISIIQHVAISEALT